MWPFKKKPVPTELKTTIYIANEKFFNEMTPVNAAKLAILLSKDTHFIPGYHAPSGYWLSMSEYEALPFDLQAYFELKSVVLQPNENWGTWHS